MARFVLVRHAAPAIDPSVPTERWGLTADGERAARRLAGLPELREIDCFVSSPEPKALGTARAIAAGRKVSIDEDLRELDRKALPWFASGEEYENVIAAILSHPDESVDGCETAAATQCRVTDAVLRHTSGALSFKLAFVTHGIALTLCVSELLGCAPDLALWRRLGMPDAAVIDTVAKTVQCASWSISAHQDLPG